MKDGATYPLNTAIAVLISGDPGSGKTNFCFEWPDPYILDCEGNLRNAIERHPGKRFWFDSPERGSKDEVLPVGECWPRLEALVKENAPKPEVRSLVWDGLGRSADYLKDYLIASALRNGEKLLSVAGQPQMTITLWGEYGQRLKRFITLMRSFNKPLVVTTHLKVDENDLTAAKEQRVNIQGALSNDCAKLFTDFWQTFAVPNSDDRYKKTNGVRYYIRTAPTHRIALKCACGLPAEFETGDACFQKLMTTISQPVAAADMAGKTANTTVNT